jgi:hypothetical protein
MFNSDILEVAIGLVFVYLLMSLIATAAQEAVETWLKKRGLFLENGLREMFGHDTLPAQGAAGARPATGIAAQPLLERFYKHPLIFSLFRGDYRPPEQRTAAAVKARKAKAAPGAKAEATTVDKLPSYIPSSHFANAILGVAESYLKPGAGGEPFSIDRLTMAAWAVPNVPVRRMLLLALESGKGDMEEVRKFLEGWFDGTMDRVSGWYRRRTQIFIFCGGLAVCVALNVNTIVIANALHQSTALRAAVSAAATDWAKTHSATVQPSAGEPSVPAKAPAPAAASAAAPSSATGSSSAPAVPSGSAGPAEQFKAPVSQLEALDLPIGWSEAARAQMAARLTPGIVGHFLGGMELLLGWLMTAFAITLGAPFWFDVLNTIMVVRSTVKPTEKSPVEPSKDGNAAPAPAQPVAPAPAGANSMTAPVFSAANAGALEIGALDPALRPREEDLEDFMGASLQ